MPDTPQNEPAGQSRHAVDPAGAYDPDKHSDGAGTTTDAQAYPTGQSMHTVADDAEYCPA